MNLYNSESFYVPLDDYDLFEISGTDCESFLQGQLTNDILKLQTNHFQWQSRCDRSGRLKGYFLIGKTQECYLSFIPKSFSKNLLEDLDKFIISEDVNIKKIEEKYYFVSDYKIKPQYLYLAFYLGKWGYLSKHMPDDLSSLSAVEKEKLILLTGQPCWGENVKEGMLINETILDEWSVSYNKGCFLGQETISKIHNNKGASLAPVLLNFDRNYEDNIDSLDIFFENRNIGHIYKSMSGKFNWCGAFLKREYRIEGKKLDILINQKNYHVTVKYFLDRKKITLEESARNIYHLALENYHQNQIELATDQLTFSIELDPLYTDAYEMLGVIYSRLGQFDKAHFYMDKLIELDPTSVMAHSNKSFFYMQQGKIKEAEDYKSLALVKSFEKLGQESKDKKVLLEKQKAQEEEKLKREKMFKEVLEIDPEDVVALFGLGSLSLEKELYNEAKAYLEKVLELDPGHSASYLKLGQVLVKLGFKDLAKSIYEKGIEISSKKGELMPANQMQSLLSSLQ